MTTNQHIVARLQSDGVGVVETFFSTREWEQISAIYAARLQEGLFRNARVGPGEAQLDREVRKDQVSWIAGDETDLVWFARKIGSLRRDLNKELFLGLQDDEMHFSLYPEGAFYRRHRDCFVGSDRRVVSFVAYLNPQWKTEWGGQLKIVTVAGEVTIFPEPNRAVFFLSELEHEVCETAHARRSLTGWFRRAAPVLL